MNYRTVDELDHFKYGDAQVVEIQQSNGHLNLVLDGVTILSDNSCNRDIREMGCNDLHIKLQEIQNLVIIEEGYTSYNADGVLQDKIEDCVLEVSAYEELFQELVEGYVYSFEKKDAQYEISIDGEERTYTIQVQATHDVEEWNRFINKL